MGKLHNEVESYSRNMGFEYRASYDANNNVIYEGWAYATSSATSEDALVWQVVKHTYDASNNLTKSSWANYEDSFNKSWTLHTSYSFA